LGLPLRPFPFATKASLNLDDYNEIVWQNYGKKANTPYTLSDLSELWVKAIRPERNLEIAFLINISITGYVPEL